MKQAKAKETTDKYGLKYLAYKVDRKTIIQIEYPNEYTNGYRVVGRGWCHGLHSKINECIKDAESYLNNYFSVLGGVEIVYC